MVDQKQDEQREGRLVAQVVFFSTAGVKRIHLPAQDGTRVNIEARLRILRGASAAPRLQN